MSKKCTIKDIANACGVSTATVSYVLNNTPNQSIGADTRRRILHYANLRGYAPHAIARALALGNAGKLGLYCPHMENSSFKLKLLSALSKEAERVGRDLVIMNDSCLKVQNSDVDGIFAVDVSKEDFARIGENTFVPLIYLEGKVSDYLFYSITVDAESIKKKVLDRGSYDKVLLAAETVHCEAYMQYLCEVFDAVIPPDSAASAQKDPNTALICLADEVDFATYAHAAVEAFLSALACEPVPAEQHYIKIQ